MSWKKQFPINIQIPSEQQIISELENEKLEINRIQQQRDVILKLQESFLKKQLQIQRLTSLVQKYRPYYEQCSTMKLELAQKQSTLKNYLRENQLLRRQFEQLILDCQHLAAQIKSIQLQKQALVRQRHSIERVNRQIEETFKQYQIQCRRREQDLLREINEYSKQNLNLQTTLQQLRNMKQQENNASVAQGEDLKALQTQLLEKQKQLQKAKTLNHELSIQFDKSVNKICQFQRQLNSYRIENHQLKKTLGLVLEQDKYQKLHQKYMNKKVPDVPYSESEEQDSGPQSSPEMSDVKF